ncbi:MAG: hypothetical protein JWP20_2905, partial [Roseomonas sp.]|nr:hypothetical protein [Roseomonas sp.]
VPERRVGSLFVVVTPPVLDADPGISQGQKPRGVQALGAEPGVGARVGVAAAKLDTEHPPIRLVAQAARPVTPALYKAAAMLNRSLGGAMLEMPAAPPLRSRPPCRWAERSGHLDRFHPRLDRL